jgi:hypothetical protein
MWCHKEMKMSKKNVMYCQCCMERKTNGGIAVTVSYIPEKFAKIGSAVKLKDDYGRWTDGWIVKSAGEPSELPDDPQQAIKKHRRNTGDSLPKGNPNNEKACD